MIGARVRAVGRVSGTLRLAPPVLLALVTLLAIACSNGGDDDATATSGPATATATVTATEPPEPVIVSPAVLDSYRYAVELHVDGNPLDESGGTDATATPPALDGASFTITIDGEVVNPDREHSQTTASLGFIELALERIQIGDQAWTREAGGEWKTATPGATSSAIGGDLDITPARIFAADGSAFGALSDQLRAIAFSAEELDGLATRRYDLDPEQFRAVFGGEPGLLPGDSQPLETRGTLWVAEESRVPVRIQLTSIDAQGDPAFEMDLTLSDLNDPITIEPPL